MRVVLPLQPIVNSHHSELQQVGRAALQRCVGGFALGAITRRNVAAVNLGDRPETAEKRSHAPRGASLLHDALEAFAHARVAPEILVDVLLSLGLAGAGAGGQAKRTDAIHHAVVDCLGDAAVLVRLQGGRHSENFLRRAGMYVLVAREGLDQQRFFGDMRQHPQLDLRVICGNQLPTGLAHKGGANQHPVFIPDGDILQVRVGG